MKARKKKVILICLILLITCFSYYQWSKPSDVNKKVLEKITETEKTEEEVEQAKIRIKEIDKPKEAYKQKEINRLKEINPDVLGVLDIPNTQIKYPVVQGKDNEFYLKHNIKKEYDINGSIFMDYENDYLQSDNLILYGHNMLNGTMFSDLGKYKDKTYMKENRDIFLYLDDKKEYYQVIGSMILNLYTENKIFNFNSYVNFDEYYGAKDYFQDIKKEANNLLVDQVEEDTQFLTISTCSYETDDARFVLFATKVDLEGENQKEE